ncbi:MAG: hypothetical protein JWN15_3121, partial [Firmicutes bacterium]|nr:hypothetical protein [Bacillota bacterium]
MGTSVDPGDGGGGSGLQVSDMSRQAAQRLVTQIVGTDVAISNVSFRGTQYSAGTFTGGSGILGFE